MHSEALGYIFRLPRILQRSLTSLYLVTSTGILLKNSIVQYYLPKHAVVINKTLKNIYFMLYCVGHRQLLMLCETTYARYSLHKYRVFVYIDLKFLITFITIIIGCDIQLSQTLLVRFRVSV